MSPDPPIRTAAKTPTDSFVLVVPATGAGVRLDHYLLTTGRFSSRHQIQKLIQDRHIRVGDRPVKPSYRLKPAEEILARIPEPEPLGSAPEPIPLDVVHEDEDLLVVDKPAGMVVHPAAGHSRHTLVNALLHHCSDLSGIGGTQRPGIVHRLDKDTSGLLVVAKHDAAHLHLSRQFQAHTIRREYLGLVHGSLPRPSGVVSAPIGRHPRDRKKMSTRTRGGREAVTHWRREQGFHGFDLLRFRLETGRTHQIRVHMADLGHPVVGDRVYGGRRSRPRDPSAATGAGEALGRLDRFFLHAQRLGFRHPVSGRVLCFSSPLPEPLSSLLDDLEAEEAT